MRCFYHGSRLLIATLFCMYPFLEASASTLHVTNSADTNAPGTLRTVLLSANPGDTVQFDGIIQLPLVLDLF